MGLIIQVRIQWWMQVHPHRKDSATAATVQVELTNANATLAPRQCQVLLKEKFESIKLLSQTSTAPYYPEFEILAPKISRMTSDSKSATSTHVTPNSSSHPVSFLEGLSAGFDGEGTRANQG